MQIVKLDRVSCVATAYRTVSGVNGPLVILDNVKVAYNFVQ